MVSLILGINFNFWALWCLYLQIKILMLCNFFKIINFIFYIERSMNILIIYIDIIRPFSCFDCTNFMVSLIIKIINFNEIKNGPSNYACHLLCGCDFLTIFQFNTHLSHLCYKNPFFEMKNFKLITWYPNITHIMWNDMVQYICLQFS
jgi:hypothetical protein